MANAPAAWDRIADVVVVGSGGTTAVSGGGVWVPCNPQLAGIGVADSREEALAYIRSLSRGSEPEFRRHELGLQRVVPPRPLDAPPSIANTLSFGDRAGRCAAAQPARAL